MTINPGDPRPLKDQVADAIWRAVQDGTYNPGERLPSTRALAAHYGVGHPTVTAAIAQLKRSGILESRSGSGTFVKQGKAVPSTGTESHDLLEVAEIPAPAEVADRLGSEAGEPVIVRRRLIRLDDVPAGLIESYYPADIARDTPLAEASHYDSGTIRPLLNLASYDETVFATMPTPDQRQQMYIAEGTPLLGRWRISYNSDNRPVQVTRQLVAADRYTFKHQHPIT
ncbi:GntR family transcriptional regulator [Marinactinospora rubrisoli]|uniref:GntR family transcriptional regulator n=1 Tax=Marinactinospora rubrisoli TaxID=2715399 RepID=A0ABW2KHE9_9ACTN